MAHLMKSFDLKMNYGVMESREAALWFLGHIASSAKGLDSTVQTSDYS